MSNFDEKLIQRLTKLEREVERLKVKERPVGGGGGVTDHGALTGLADNDHPQYRLVADAIDHGALSGLADNDHPQYLLTSGKAADADKLDNIDSTGFVQTSGNQSVGGVKTFGSFPVTPSSAPTTNYQVANKKYVDDNAGGVSFLQIYPVGSIYISTSSTNPSSLFGGTWVDFGAGRVLVGKATSGTFATAGATGGAETHTLTVAQMPSHTHTQDPHSHTAPSSTTGATTGTVRPGGSDTTLTTSSTTATNNNTGGDGAHNNLQPYIVVYMWRRTA